MVERVEALGPELNANPLSDPCRFVHRDIPLVCGRSTHRVFAEAAESSFGRTREGKRVEPFLPSLRVNLASDVIRTNAAAERTRVAVGSNREWRAGPVA